MKTYFPLTARHSLFCLFLLSFPLQSVPANAAAPLLHYLVQLEEDAQLEEIRHQWNQSAERRSLEPRWELLSRRIRAYKLSFPEKETIVQKAVDELRGISGIRYLKAAQPIQYRTNPPDDTIFQNQYHLTLTETAEAWDFTTGGVNALGDTIVLAILDSGFEVDHEDLEQNIWKNRDEIPNNGKDDDDNGYIDDYLGLNIVRGNDNHPEFVHGTAVAGVAGARGNNTTGISGVNWNVELMLLSELQSNLDVIEAYEYILNQRQLYDSTGGEKGAYVVATNLSAGINEAFPSDYPGWCAMYEELLDAGILSIGAAPNFGINIDEEGDIPGTCPSAGTIIVTNTDRNDVKVSEAGYGTNNVDMSAPGIDVFSLTTGSDYANHSGASYSAPQVAGAIALLHSTPCAAFAQYTKQQPREAALTLKNILTRTVEHIPSLEGISVSEGRLNINEAILDIARVHCGSKTGPFEAMNIYPVPSRNNITIEYEVPDFRTIQWALFDVRGREVLSGTIEPPAFDEKIEKIEHIERLAAGTYFLQMIHPGGNIVRKVIVQ